MKHSQTVAVRTCTAVCGFIFAISLTLPLTAGTLTIPDSSLIPSTQLYTDTTGGGIGNVVVMTGGGNAAGVGDPSGRNDDGFSGPINLGFTLNFFGTNYTQFWVNNNGNISFGNGISDYTPSGPTGAPQPIISPFFGDVDTRGANSGVVHLLQLSNEDIITWDHVGYFDSNDDKLDNFQLVLRGSGFNVPAGQGQIGFFYTTMQWETGDASGGTEGFGGTPAAVGFGDGAGNGQILQGSIHNGISGIVNDEHIWFDLNGGGVPVNPGGTVPEPASLALLLLGAGGLAAARKKFSAHR